MIEVIFDQSYEDDYFMISEINVSIDDKAEKERIEKAVIENGLQGLLGFPDKDYISGLLRVDCNLIDMDTNEIDFM